VTSLGDGRNGETISFGYDHLDRLISASAPLNESYGYDNIGRMTTRNTSGYDYTGTYHAHAPRYVAGNYYDYDPNGNLITAEGRTYEYDAENRLIRVGACSSSVKRSLFHTKTLPARS
ncbi:MAG: hypothetical protein M0T85_09905, partial [Dehalococcoidales bacterium]|nr:hypothetical protein [Dehalococcoidales bacterium]